MCLLSTTFQGDQEFLSDIQKKVYFRFFEFSTRKVDENVTENLHGEKSGKKIQILFSIEGPKESSMNRISRT